MVVNDLLKNTFRSTFILIYRNLRVVRFKIIFKKKKKNRNELLVY